MSHEKEGKEKSGKKAPAKSLKEKRAAKAAKRHESESSGKIIFGGTIPKPGKK
ncbi:MAG: hypothetical protein IH591_00695 [Bacteroidales bacterium]|nr:hypothetical protein [Bacteroidales bacterium]